MSKRDFVGGDNDDGPSSKMRKMDDLDDGGGGGRTGRVRKKSAKVLEMEEFEQAEKTSTTTKKSKVPKAAPVVASDMDVPESLVPTKKSKATASSIEATPTSRKGKKNSDGPASTGKGRSVPAELTPRVSSKTTAPSVTPIPPILVQQEIKQEASPTRSLLSSVLTKAPLLTQQELKQEDPKSVIKHLLTSPVAGTQKQPIAAITPELLATTPLSASVPVEPTSSKKSSKKIKFEDGPSAPPPTKKKEKKMKIEIMSPSEIKPPVSSAPPAPTAHEPKAPSLKMKINMSGANPVAAQVATESQEKNNTPQKVKKVSKKVKVKTEKTNEIRQEFASPQDGEKAPKKKKVSKKKEKLIQNAISAAQQMPNLAAMVSTPQGQILGLGDSPSPIAAKPIKKKAKTSSPAVKSELNTSDSLVMDFDETAMDDEGEESSLVIAETGKKKKKKVSAKKKSPKEKDSQSSEKAEKDKKIPKRAPTAYMLFCNSHRPAIVAENPGIEFASISRKLGELWQTQSNKQKLQWRRKAQRRLKKSNLISTGKVGAKESLGGPSTSTPTTSSVTQGAAPVSSTNKKLSLMLQKTKVQQVVVVDEGPLSPTKVGIDYGGCTMEHGDSDSYNFSIEPLDVAAHLKLLGESLSIIGMRLQEHKGMIAVQGSLSVLLDSLLCACGPLLCLTQQVPGMDGCSPSVHAQTLDSVAYVMPGL